MRFAGDIAIGTDRAVVHLPGTPIVANLEAPIVQAGQDVTPAPKAGPSMSARSIPQSDADWILTLANNHVGDHGSEGIASTRRHLEDAAVPSFGAGSSLAEARRPLVVDRDGERWGFIGCCETQFGVATSARGGVASLGPWVYAEIARLAEQVDHVAVSVHAAVEDAPWPSPHLQDLHRSFIDAGASVVHGHHSHVPQGLEHYNGGAIIYGPGNFVVVPEIWAARDHALWSIVHDVTFDQGKAQATREIVGIEREGDTIRVAPVAADEARRLDGYLRDVDAPLVDRPLLEGVWQEVAMRMFTRYGAEYIGEVLERPDLRSRLKDAARSAVRGARRPIDRETALLRYHMFACESHRQMVATALGIIGEELADLRTDASRRLVDRRLLALD